MFRTVARLGGIAVAAALLVAMTGCEASRTFDALCTTSPLLPHQPYLGTVGATADAPPTVHPGDTFTITVKDVSANDTQSSSPPWPTGVVSVTGAVTPSGNVAVGSITGGDGAFPVALTYTATGQPGDTIVLHVVSGTYYEIVNGAGYSETCTPGTDAVLATIYIVAPG